MRTNGSRLAYTVVKLEGTVKRMNATWTKGGIKQKLVDEPAGYMVYFPRGHALRFKDEAGLQAYGLDKRPRIINLQGLSDPNSAIGKVLLSQDEEARHGAYHGMEDMVIRLATAKSGPVLIPEQNVSRELRASA